MGTQSPADAPRPLRLVATTEALPVNQPLPTLSTRLRDGLVRLRARTGVAT